MGAGGLVEGVGMGCRQVCRREGGVGMELGDMGMGVEGRGRGWIEGEDVNGVR